MKYEILSNESLCFCFFLESAGLPVLCILISKFSSEDTTKLGTLFTNNLLKVSNMSKSSDLSGHILGGFNITY